MKRAVSRADEAASRVLGPAPSDTLVDLPCLDARLGLHRDDEHPLLHLPLAVRACALGVDLLALEVQLAADEVVRVLQLVSAGEGMLELLIQIELKPDGPGRRGVGDFPVLAVDFDVPGFTLLSASSKAIFLRNVMPTPSSFTYSSKEMTSFHLPTYFEGSTVIVERRCWLRETPSNFVMISKTRRFIWDMVALGLFRVWLLYVRSNPNARNVKMPDLVCSLFGFRSFGMGVSKLP